MRNPLLFLFLILILTCHLLTSSPHIIPSRLPPPQNPTIPKKARKAPKEKKLFKTPKLTYEERKAALKAKLSALQDAE